MSRSILTVIACVGLAGCGQSMPSATTMQALKAAPRAEMPKLASNGASIPFSGAMLPPGAKVTSIMVGAHEGADMGKAMISFESPFDPPHTRDWFLQMLRAHEFKLTAHGPNLVGHDRDGAPFRLDLAPLADGRSSGRLASG
ncbi:hypothetical protein [Sphingomonas sp.]|uniref:hypothetical protein n=1 Tax=Sphingomonas sp. TaxID=28214 RepID=UPI001DF16E37|nr:hypothetical protein [Sphingomonas sp.]MBX9797054.1 hypothetical protein [Sphingomonas sp.]